MPGNFPLPVELTWTVLTLLDRCSVINFASTSTSLRAISLPYLFQRIRLTEASIWLFDSGGKFSAFCPRVLHVTLLPPSDFDRALTFYRECFTFLPCLLNLNSVSASFYLAEQLKIPILHAFYTTLSTSPFSPNLRTISITSYRHSSTPLQGVSDVLGFVPKDFEDKWFLEEYSNPFAPPLPTGLTAATIKCCSWSLCTFKSFDRPSSLDPVILDLTPFHAISGSASTLTSLTIWTDHLLHTYPNLCDVDNPDWERIQFPAVKTLNVHVYDSIRYGFISCIPHRFPDVEHLSLLSEDQRYIPNNHDNPHVVIPDFKKLKELTILMPLIGATKETPRIQRLRRCHKANQWRLAGCDVLETVTFIHDRLPEKPGYRGMSECVYTGPRGFREMKETPDFEDPFHWNWLRVRGVRAYLPESSFADQRISRFDELENLGSLDHLDIYGETDFEGRCRPELDADTLERMVYGFDDGLESSGN